MSTGIKVKLPGGPQKTVTWVWLEERQLKVEYYDFSELAQQMFGNDIAHTITVSGMDKLLSASRQTESSVIAWLAENFQSYFEVKRWLEEESIPFSVEMEGWA